MTGSFSIIAFPGWVWTLQARHVNGFGLLQTSNELATIYCTKIILKRSGLRPRYCVVALSSGGGGNM